MSSQIVEQLKNFSDGDIFYKLYISRFDNYERQVKDRFEKDLVLFQSSIENRSQTYIFKLSELMRIVPYYLELATRINKCRKHNTYTKQCKKYLPYDFEGYRIVNNHLVLTASDYLKMRLKQVVDVKMVNNCLRIPLVGERRAKNLFANAIAKIKSEDDWVLKVSRDMMKTLIAMSTNVSTNYYDVY
jgi:hypothetical protein